MFAQTTCWTKSKMCTLALMEDLLSMSKYWVSRMGSKFAVSYYFGQRLTCTATCITTVRATLQAFMMRWTANLSTVDFKETGRDNEVGLFEPGIDQLEDITGYTTLTTFSQQQNHMRTLKEVSIILQL